MPDTTDPQTIYVAAPPAPKRSMTMPLLAAAAAGALLGAIAGGATGIGVSAWVVNSAPTSTTSSGPSSITVNNPDDVTAVTAIAAKAAPSVVTISATSRQGAGSGSGIIISADGDILTNAHVVTLGGLASDAKLEITTTDGRILPAEIVGLDPVTDLAVLRAKGGGGFTPIEWASSAELNVGDLAVVIGAPLGLSNSVSDGIVSALHRGIRISSSEVRGEESAPGEGGPEFDFDIPGVPTQPSSGMISIPVIQTDAAVNPGNSGGALVDGEGRLIGVIVAIASTGSSGGSVSGSIGVGFAIPSDLAQRVSQELIDDGAATHGLLGLTARNAGSDDGILGAVVTEVMSGGAGAQAGLKPGDVITSVGGLPVTSAVDLTAQVRALAAGSETTIGYSRGGAAATAQVTLGSLQ